MHNKPKTPGYESEWCYLEERILALYKYIEKIIYPVPVPGDPVNPTYPIPVPVHCCAVPIDAVEIVKDTITTSSGMRVNGWVMPDVVAQALDVMTIQFIVPPFPVDLDWNKISVVLAFNLMVDSSGSLGARVRAQFTKFTNSVNQEYNDVPVEATVFKELQSHQLSQGSFVFLELMLGDFIVDGSRRFVSGDMITLEIGALLDQYTGADLVLFRGAQILLKSKGTLTKFTERIGDKWMDFDHIDKYKGKSDKIPEIDTITGSLSTVPSTFQIDGRRFASSYIVNSNSYNEGTGVTKDGAYQSWAAEGAIGQTGLRWGPSAIWLLVRNTSGELLRKVPIKRNKDYIVSAVGSDQRIEFQLSSNDFGINVGGKLVYLQVETPFGLSKEFKLLAGAFDIPIVSTVTPETDFENGSIAPTITLSGANFTGASQIELVGVTSVPPGWYPSDGQSYVLATGPQINVINDGLIQVTVSAPVQAVLNVANAGFYEIIVTNPAGQNSSSASKFRISPRITSATPPLEIAGNDFLHEISGSKFDYSGIDPALVIAEVRYIDLATLLVVKTHTPSSVAALLVEVMVDVFGVPGTPGLPAGDYLVELVMGSPGLPPQELIGRSGVVISIT